MDDERIAAVRRFNRLVTRRIGALEEDFLGRSRPLGQSRVLFEIGEDGAELRDLRALLELDSGYLSRLVRTLEEEGLVEVGALPGDERVRLARVTEAGRREVAEMDARSDAAASALLDPLSPRARRRLVAAMDEVRRLLLASEARVERMHPADPHALLCLRAYYEELDRRFPEGFRPADSLPAPEEALVPPRGAFLVARVEGRPVACGALLGTEPGAASVKRMWVDREMRGVGLGRRILRGLEEEAAALGIRLLRLETHAALEEAVALYRSAGYREVAPFNDDPYAAHWFEKRLEL